MAFRLPKLPYSYSSLEPYIDKKTMIIHHTKHHATYIAKLNEAMKVIKTLNGKGIEDILRISNKLPAKSKQAIINNAGGHANHSLYWKIMTPKPKKGPDGKLSEVLISKFGGVEMFKEKFTETAMNVFGSGWAFLIIDNKGKIALKKHSFQNSPYMKSAIPILGIDLWEHAYYLKYQNRRIDYINAWWKVFNWDEAEKNFNNAMKDLT